MMTILYRHGMQFLCASAFILLILGVVSVVYSGNVEPLPPIRKQAEIRQEWLRIRLERVLPALMRKHNVRMWLVICREYNEDPVFLSLASPTTFAARRRTIFVFNDRGKDGVERLALGGGSHGGLYTVYRDPDLENRELWGEGQWALLRKVIEERNPETIAVDISRTHAFSDGLSAGENEALQEALGDRWKKRIVRAELLPLEYLAVRIPEMEPTYRQMMEIAHSLIRRAFSSEVVQPGKTTSQDVVWWLRQQVQDMGMQVWFQPSVRVQRKGATGVNLLKEDEGVVIQRGDVLHTDFGIFAMGLCTDTQHMGYVLNEGETAVPAGIRKALTNTNRLQDILIERMKPGRIGNQVLADALAAMKAEGIQGSVYTHPIGDRGHGAGPLIGLWDRQQELPGRGDVTLLPDTWFAIELSAETPVPEWDNQKLWIGQEEDAMMQKETMTWVLPRQTEFHLIH